MALNWFKKKQSKPDKTKHPEQSDNQESEELPAGDKGAAQIPDASNPHNDAEKETSGPQASTDQDSRPQGPAESSGFFKRLKNGLSKTRKLLTTDIDELFASNRKIDDDLLEELEELLITSDIGVHTTMDFIESISKKTAKISDAKQLKDTLKEKILSLLATQTAPPAPMVAKPHVVMVIGVNGVGKTTTIGKLAAKAVAGGQKVLIVAADTFRAAAVEQLVIWAQRAGVDTVRHKDGADPAAVAYDGIEAAIARGTDIVLIDTAGRLHTRVNLMEELKKIKRTLAKKLPDAPHEILLILDATTGQNALAQAQMFNDALGVTGIALTKLDGTAKGGIVVSICSSLEIPLKYVGIGEKIEDLQEFDPASFVNALF